MSQTQADLLKEANDLLTRISTPGNLKSKSMPPKEIGEQINFLIKSTVALGIHQPGSLPQFSEIDPGINGLIPKTLRSYAELTDDLRELINVLK